MRLGWAGLRRVGLVWLVVSAVASCQPRPARAEPIPYRDTLPVVVTFANLPSARMPDDPYVSPCEAIDAPGPGPVLLTPATMGLCPDILPFFRPGDPSEHLRALLTVECESNGDPLANDRAWGHLRNRPQGVWSAMSEWTPQRSLDLFGWLIDPYDTRQASMFAAALIRRDGWSH